MALRKGDSSIGLTIALAPGFDLSVRSCISKQFEQRISYSGQHRRGARSRSEKSFDDVVLSRASTSEEAGKSFDQATDRLSLLTYVHDIIGLPDPSLLNGDAKIWLAPLYPLIPRIVWKDKPVLDKGRRLSVALGRPSTTSSAVTPVGIALPCTGQGMGSWLAFFSMACAGYS